MKAICFVFNLSSVGRQEKIISAEIHIYRKKAKKAKKKKDPEMLVYEVAPQYMTLSKQVSLHQSSRGWHSVQVTEPVRSCLSARRLQPHLLALTFEGENNKGRASLLSLKRFISRHSLPFLIVFSNDTANNITLDHLDPHYGKPSTPRKSSPLKNNPSSVPLPHPNFFHGTDFTLEELGLSTNVNHRLPDTPLKEETDDSTVVTNDTGEQEAAVEILAMSEDGDDNATEVVQRAKRSMVDNKIPEEPFDFSSLNFNIPQTHPSILVSREESRQHQSSSKLIPYPESSRKGRRGKKNRNRKRNRKNRRRRRKHNKQSLPLPHEWEEQDNKTTVIKDDTLCSRKKLVVNFADIGWGEWIIAPASFEAHYCAGSCPFPLTKSLRPSNHATIQSIINVIGIRPEVPAPCCVPEVMTSATLLYFDGNKNVVLKNYPHMSVQSCSCR
ncbi:uncharacterized protein LOC135481779 [Liolophura sinensis]|uniref:uncharacterized protein LOC135481779 n=1 Tax=Liolophura sinensis TaxID=3198878 RepID=UPI003158952C